MRFTRRRDPCFVVSSIRRIASRTGASIRRQVPEDANPDVSLPEFSFSWSAYSWRRVMSAMISSSGRCQFSVLNANRVRISTPASAAP
jgi:hypothetical protein